MAKFGRFYQREIGHSLFILRKQRTLVGQAVRMLRLLSRPTAVQDQLIAHGYLLLEDNAVVKDAFKFGYISAGLHQLRHSQEIVHKMWALWHKPELAGKKRVTHAEVTAVMSDSGYPHWRKFYGLLSSVSHADKTFLLNIYPTIGAPARVSKEAKLFVEYYLMILSVLNQKALAVLYQSLEKNIGSDYQQLIRQYESLESIVLADSQRIESKQDNVFGVPDQ